MLQFIIENTQVILLSALILLTAYQLMIVSNKWYYPYFLEKINLRPTNDFDKTDFIYQIKRFFIFLAATLLVYFIPLKWSLSLIMMSVIIYQLYIIDVLSVKLKKVFGLKY